MTTIEHALLAVNGVLAAGCQRRYGWQLAALAAVAAVSPDWDGLTIVVSFTTFAAGHRVWGHNIWACLLTAAVIASLDYRFDLVTRVGSWLAKTFRVPVPGEAFQLRRHFTLATWGMWLAVAALAALSHLLADMLVSGTAELPPWQVHLAWPFSKRGWVFPLVRWGDPGMTLIFVAGMFAMLRWKSRCEYRRNCKRA